MISGALATGSGTFFERLEARGKHFAERRAKNLAQALHNADHRWRSAAALWPDLGLE